MLVHPISRSYSKFKVYIEVQSHGGNVTIKVVDATSSDRFVVVLCKRHVLLSAVSHAFVACIYCSHNLCNW